MVNIQVNEATAERLFRRATAEGVSVSDLLDRVVAECALNGHSREERLASLDRFLAAMKQHAATLPPGHIVDDSREGIYEGRGE